MVFKVMILEVGSNPTRTDSTVIRPDFSRGGQLLGPTLGGFRIVATSQRRPLKMWLLILKISTKPVLIEDVWPSKGNKTLIIGLYIYVSSD